MTEVTDPAAAAPGTTGCAQMRQSLARLTAQLAELEGLTCAKEAEVEELKLQPDPDQGRIDQLEAEIASNYVEIDGLTLQISSLSQVIDEHC